MQSNWFRQLFIHILYISLQMQRLNLLACLQLLSYSRGLTMADFSSSVPLVMGKLKMDGCWCMAQTTHALGRLKLL